MLERLAARMRVWGIIDRDDLVQSAALALMRTRDLYDPSRGLKWPTLAFWRARGAMLDALRSVDHVSRLTRRRLKAAGLEGEKIYSLDRQPAEVEREGFLGGVWESSAEDRDIWIEVRRRLPVRAAEIVEGYYRDGRTLFEIGEILGLSESRVSQLLRRAIAALRSKWAPIT